MRFSTKILLALNKLFKAPVHPLNLQDEGVMSYAMWQYKKGAETIRYYLEAYTEDDMFRGKTVLDIGLRRGRQVALLCVARRERGHRCRHSGKVP